MYHEKVTLIIINELKLGVMLLRKKGKVIFIGCLLIVLLTLFLYSLSEELYYEWLEDEYNIERITGYNGYTYTKDKYKERDFKVR